MHAPVHGAGHCIIRGHLCGHLLAAQFGGLVFGIVQFSFVDLSWSEKRGRRMVVIM